MLTRAVTLIQAELAMARGRRDQVRCERCVMSGRLGPSAVVLEQVRDPRIAFYRVIGLCQRHFQRPEVYKQHGWKKV